MALAVATAVAAMPTLAQPALEPVERPRTDHYEQPVQDQLTAAEDALDRELEAAERDPARLTQAYGRVGQLYLLHDLMAPAAAALRNAEALDPRNPRWPYFLAVLYIFEGKLEQAVAALDRVVVLAPRDLAARIRRADTLLQLDQVEDAEAEYRTILDLEPNHSAAYFGLGRVEFERGNFEPALELFKTALRGQPEGSAAHHHIGLTLRRLGRREEALEQLKRNEHVRIAYPDPLFASLQRLNTSREAHVKRGTEAMLANDLDGALAAFLAADEALPDDPMTLFNIGMVLIELGDKAGAEERLRRAIGLDPDYREPHFNLALILAERHDFGGAQRHFRRASEIDPDDLEARIRLAEALTRLGRYDEAIATLHGVLATDPAQPMAHLALGAANQAAGNDSAARAALLEVLEAAPGAPRERAEAHYRLAVLAEDDPQAAEAQLGQAIELDGDFAEAHALLGRLLARRQQFGTAASHFARALARDSGNARWHGDRAMALILGERYRAAKGALQSGRGALSRAGGTSAAALDHLDTLLARLLAASPDPVVRNGPEALTIAERLMSERPSLEHGETLAMALAEVGEYERAASLQRQVLAETRRRGLAATIGQEERLRSYENGEPVREPWFSP